MITHVDEILQKAVSTDSTAVPRYNLVRPDGTVVERNVALKLANAIAQDGTPINKALLDEFLAASGVTAGSGSAYTLAQEGYELFDGAPVRFQLHTASSDGATLDINGTGAKPLVDMMGAAMAGGIPAETWLTAMYSAAAGAYVLAGGEAVQALYGERYAVDDAVAHVKDVPEDALPYAEVGEVGGMTYKVNVGTEAAPVYELRSAAVTEVESVGRNLFDKSKVINATETDTGFSFVWDGLNMTPNTIGKLKNLCPALRVGDVVYLNGNTVNSSLGRETAFLYLAGGAIDWEGQAVKITDNILNGYVYAYGETGKLCEYKDVIISKIANAPYIPYTRKVISIPKAVQEKEWYGLGLSADVCNSIRWNADGRRTANITCKSITFDGSEDEKWTLAQYTNFVAYFNDPALGILRTALLCDNFEVYNDGMSDKPDGTIGVSVERVSTNHSGFFFGVKGIATGAEEWRAYLAAHPVTLVYELATPIITDISDLLHADNILPVEAGGTITAVNEHGYAVPTTITYQRNVLANRASTFAVKKLRLALELLASIDYVDEAIKPLATTAAVNTAIAAAVKGLATTDNVTDAINTHKAESAAHNAASIVTDTTRQFVSAAEKAAWNEGTGGNAKVLSNTRITTDSTSITIDLPTDYNYFRIVLSEVATTDDSLGAVRCSLNTSNLTSSGLQLGAGDSEGDAFVMHTESEDYVFNMLLYDSGTFGSVTLDIVRFSSMTQGTCRWATDGNGSDAAVSMAMSSFSASGVATSMTISVLGGYYLKHGTGITVIGVK